MSNNRIDIYAKENKRNKRRKFFQKRLKNFRILLATLLIGVVAIIFLLPIVLTVTNSFMAKTEISANYGSVFPSNSSSSSYGGSTSTNSNKVVFKDVNLKFIPDMVSFEQYNTVLFKSPDYLLKFWNSVILVVPIVIFQTLISVMAAYGLSRVRRKWKEVVFFTYIIMMLMPYQVTLVPNYLVAEKLHILNTNWAIWLPGIFSPFAVYMLTKYIRRIPSGIIEAAEIDGCNEWEIFWRIAFPLSKGSMASVAILIFIDYWNMVEQPIILMSDDNLHPLSVFLSKINSGEIGLAFAVASIYMFLPLFVFLYGEEFLVEGISYQGGVKG